MRRDNDDCREICIVITTLFIICVVTIRHTAYSALHSHMSALCVIERAAVLHCSLPPPNQC